ncbi:hypothetical protein ABZ907_07365 [Nonomuraea wenchangensis]
MKRPVEGPVLPLRRPQDPGWLLDELIGRLNDGDLDLPSYVRAATGHLNLVRLKEEFAERVTPLRDPYRPGVRPRS